MRAVHEAVVTHRRAVLGLIAATVSACLLTACAGSAPPGPQEVGLSVVAPTSGATVNVRLITVLGHVAPAGARVLISGRRAAVRKGMFRLRMVLARRLNRIGIVASAPGYDPAAVETTVRYVGRRGAAPGSDYIDRAEAICLATDDRLGRLGPVDILTDPSGALRNAAVMQEMVQHLGSVTVPRSVDGAYHRLLARTQGYMQVLSDFEADLRAGNLVNAGVLRQRFDASEPSMYNEASRLDIPDCGGIPMIPAQP